VEKLKKNEPYLITSRTTSPRKFTQFLFIFRKFDNHNRAIGSLIKIRKKEIVAQEKFLDPISGLVKAAELISKDLIIRLMDKETKSGAEKILYTIISDPKNLTNDEPCIREIAKIFQDFNK